ncbi:tetraspanin-18-like [Littorina saxatilis]|uniref:Tetraspanin n=1 Tax=Littorina saxatilis TaxID=31220 RepID=A0AAN9B3N6_9CAEN
MSCGASCARLLLIAFNFVFWLSGVAILGVGIWILVDPNLQDYIDVIHTTDEEYFKNAAYILIAFGAFIFLVGFCGCCGAIRNSKCLLGFYIFFLVCVFAGELAAGILAAIYKDEITDKLNAGLTKSIKEEYLDNAASWDAVQKELKCCGGVGPQDYVNSTWQEGKSQMIPVSCCVLDSNGEPKNASYCQNKTKDFYHETGCKEALTDWVKDKSIILIGVGCGIAALQIIGVILAICLCRSLNQEKY